jgi:hypothetical protein
VQQRGSLNFSFFSWLFCYCCNHKRELYLRAYDRRDQELDLIKIGQTVRKADFLTRINEEKYELFKYGHEYRVIDSYCKKLESIDLVQLEVD